MPRKHRDCEVFRGARAIAQMRPARSDSLDLSLPVIEIALRCGSALRAAWAPASSRWRWWPKGRLTPIRVHVQLGLPGRHVDRPRGGRLDERGSRSPDACAQWTI